MKKFIVPLITVAVVVSIILAGCVPVRPPEAPEIWATPERLADYQRLVVDKGLVEPDLELNPYEGLAIKPDGTPYNFSICLVFQAVDYCVQEAGYAPSLMERAGAEYSLFSAEMDVTRQIGWMEDQIAAVKPDMIAAQGVNVEVLATAVDKAWEAGIPFVGFEEPLWTSEHSVSVVWHDSADPEYGLSCLGQFFVDRAEELGYTEENPMLVLEVWGDRGAGDAQRRHKGFHMATDKSPIVEVMESRDSEWQDPIATEIVVDALTAYPDIKGVWAQGGGGAGMIEGVKTAGRAVPYDDPTHVFVLLTDCDLPTVQAMDAGVVDGSATQSCLIIDPTVKILFNYAILGQPVSKVHAIPILLVTPENIDTQMHFGCISSPPRLPAERWDLWPVLDTAHEDLLLDENRNWVALPTPTVAMRKELLGY